MSRGRSGPSRLTPPRPASQRDQQSLHPLADTTPPVDASAAHRTSVQSALRRAALGSTSRAMSMMPPRGPPLELRDLSTARRFQQRQGAARLIKARRVHAGTLHGRRNPRKHPQIACCPETRRRNPGRTPSQRPNAPGAMMRCRRSKMPNSRHLQADADDRRRARAYPQAGGSEPARTSRHPPDSSCLASD
jgi:hypothetical protein